LQISYAAVVRRRTTEGAVGRVFFAVVVGPAQTEGMSKIFVGRVESKEREEEKG